MPRRVIIILGLLACAVLALAAVRVVVGGLDFPPAQRDIILSLRGTRVITAALTGASLAVAGALLQSLLRNPLASPDLLGLSSGAGLGVMIAIFVSFLAGSGLADPGGIGATGAAIIGACAALALVYAASQRKFFVEPVTLILVGVIVGVMCSAGITLLKHLLPDQGVAAARLLVGALRDDVHTSHLVIATIILCVSTAVALTMHRSIDACSLSDDEATSIGINIRRVRLVQFLCAGTLTAASVVLAGPIGFVGLIAPHAVRLTLGPRTAPLLLGCLLTGAALVIAADTLVALVREVFPSTGRLPISVITALIGGPVFIYLLRRERPTAL
jgi:iron complex transport system permease protein